jgi:hypothetical protein
VRRAIWAARGRWILRPSYLTYARRRHTAETIEGSTELVIEGFPRTANTFCVFAFQLAQLRPVRVAHHLHAPIQVATAVRLDKPVIVLIRPPMDAVLSLVLRNPYVTIERALKDYSRFYEQVAPLRDRCVVGAFHEVTTDFGEVVRRVNRRYGTRFSAFTPTGQNVAECYALIEERSRQARWAEEINLYVSGLLSREGLDAARRTRPGTLANPVSEVRVARPSDYRQAQKTLLRAAYDDAALRTHRARAERAYAGFLA